MFVLDLVYCIVLAFLSPWLLWRALATGRYRRDLAAKLLGSRLSPSHSKPVVWFHAVSVGEINLLGTLVPAFRARHPGWRIVVSSTTDTGLEEARKRFAEHTVIAWPLDFSWAVGATLDAVKPAVVVLSESELWPNFLTAAQQRGVPVIVVNARMSPRSFRRSQRVGGLVRWLLFRKVTRFAVQEQEYAERFRGLGLPAERILVTGSIKYDGAAGERDTARTHELGRLLGVNGAASSPGERPLIWLAGSTHAPEETLVLAAFARLREREPRLRLILVPRHPDRFEEVARLVEQSGLPFVRRSRIGAALPEMPAVVLLDTIGELGAAWGLADLGFTGGSLDGKRGGQSMIEPAGFGVPCVFGPHIWNFRDAARRLVEVGGAIMLRDAAQLEAELAALIADPARRQGMGTAARELVLRQQGATQRTLDALDALLPATGMSRPARCAI